MPLQVAWDHGCFASKKKGLILFFFRVSFLHVSFIHERAGFVHVQKVTEKKRFHNKFQESVH